MNKSGITPAGHRILVKPEKIEEKTSGGIFIPDEAKDMEQHAVENGVVIKVGPEAWKLDTHKGPWAKVGDRVVFKRYEGKVVKGKDGEDYRLLNDENVIAILE